MLEACLMSYDLKAEILELKKKQNAVILAHYYEEGEIQDLADHVGDSFYLAQMGQKVEAPVILLAGVVFMAESVKLLNPNKTVLVPDLDAGCSLVTGSPVEAYRKWREEFPEALAVTYINSSIGVKALSDVIITSSNAEKIISSIPKERKILFGPDKNLGRFLSQKLNRPMEFWPGVCEVHVLFSARKLFELTQEHPDAVVIAHPECEDAILQYASVIGSTSRLLEEVKNNPAKKFIVATETGIFHQMQKLRPEVTLIQAPTETSCACNNCPYMKLNTLEKIRDSLKSLSPQLTLSENLSQRAALPLQRMLDIASGKSILWPERWH